MNCIGKTTLKPAYDADKGASASKMAPMGAIFAIERIIPAAV
jgi:hypothetical protein